MRRTLLRRISLLLVLAFIAIAGADLVCAWPCLISGSTASRNSRSEAAHSCHSAGEQTGAPAVAAAAQACGMEHALDGPVAERVQARKSLQLDFAATVDDSLLTFCCPSAAIRSFGWTAPTSFDPPGSFSPLRI